MLVVWKSYLFIMCKGNALCRGVFIYMEGVRALRYRYLNAYMYNV